MYYKAFKFFSILFFFSFSLLISYKRWFQNVILAEFPLSVGSFPEISENLKISSDFGHWILNESAPHNYTFHELPGRPIIPPVKKSISTLVEKNIKLVTFLGDSHIRELFKHIESIVTGRISSKVLIYFKNLDF